MTNELRRVKRAGDAWETVSEDESGGGGSQTVRLLGPFHFDYTDFPVDDTELVIFTPNAGDYILRGLLDQASAITFQDSGGVDFAIGETPDFNNATVPGTFWGIVGNAVASDLSQNLDSDSSDAAIFLFSYVSTGAPLKIRAQSLLNPTAGEMDLYFLVATPTAP